MDTELANKLQGLETKVDAIYVSVEKTRKYFRWIFWGTVAMFLIPLIALLFVIPMFLNNYVGAIAGVL